MKLKHVCTVEKSQRELKKIAGDADNMDESDEEEIDENVWGKGKKTYYDAGEHSGEDEDYEEMLRIKREKDSKLSKKDFGLEDDESDEEDKPLKVNA